MRLALITTSALLACAGLTACGNSGGIGGGSDAGGGEMSIPTSAGGVGDTRTDLPSSAAAASGSAAAQARASVHASGAVTIDATGSGASCGYYDPATSAGVDDSVTSTHLSSATGNAGDWKLTITGQGQEAPTVVLTTARGAFAGTAKSGGTVAVQPQGKGATFDLTLVDAQQQQAHLTGSITCP
ncbi:MAG: hypothetical protein ACTHMS_21440 [Jatrophihabitans sp.]|uniref:hypothetical protein n=1 Tax=Jatrophihabitans sp. TaxID=1932789 RepID=UPI003F7FD58E